MSTIKQKALEHYDRMIAWVESLNDLNNSPNYLVMQKALNESWWGKSCHYCQEFNDCGICPLVSKNACCSGLWKKMDYSDTWNKWLEYAKQVKNYIEKNG